MRLSRTRIMTAAGGGLLVLGAVISPAAAAQAVTPGPALHPGVIRLSPGAAGRIRSDSVNGQCGVWTDYTTFGVGCDRLTDWNIYVQAKCKNGKYVSGKTQLGTSNIKSYAYCSSVNSTVQSATFVTYPTGGSVPQRAEASRAGQRARAALAAVAAQRPRDSVTPDNDVNGNCLVWSDGTTFGSACDAMLGWFYQSQASCKNGKRVYGPTQVGNTLNWSYAYCSSVKSTVNFGDIVFTY
jgi:hypothetical protein